MTNEFTIIETAFRDALTCGDDDRERFLIEFAAAHPSLDAPLRALLAADAESVDAFSGPSTEALAALVDDASDPWIGRQLGSWRLERRIGAGGMAEVFAATRADDAFEQSVAVKVMASQLIDSNAVERFRIERQILANLDHPFVAKLIDGGTTDERLPFLVMELVEGEPIDSFCDERGMTVRDRLRLFVDVCAAVEHAHRKLVVHRDLKPSNILVVGSGEPKLLDFGIAKLLDAERIAAGSTETRTGFTVMTPEYASPEQVRGETVSVATDVYSLGVVLFRLLVGRSPYGDSAQSARELEEAIVSSLPTRPSAAATDVPEAAANARATSADRLRRALAGDVDRIVLKCLHKEPERRYGSVRELAEDIERHLSDKPVLARGDNWTYRAGKFARRHVRALAVAVATLVAAAGITTYYTINLAAERDRARLEAAKAAQVSAFVTSLFDAANPFASPDRNVTARELLDRGAERIDADLGDQPAVRATMLEVVGRAYLGLGDFETASANLRRSLRGYDELFDGAHPDLARAHLHLGRALLAAGSEADSEEHFRTALSMRERLRGTDHPDVAEALYWLGATLNSAGRYQDAVTLLRRALAIRVANLSPARADVMRALGVSMYHTDQFDEAERLYREALPILTATHGDTHWAVADLLYDLGNLMRHRNRFEEGRAYLEEVVRIERDVYGPEHPTLADSMSSLAALLAIMGRYDESLKLQREALAIRRRTLDANHPSIAESIVDLGLALHLSGDYSAGEALYREALEHEERALGQGHPNLASTMDRISWVLTDQKKFADALPWARRALAHHLRTHDETSMTVAHSRMHMARALAGLNQFQAARSEIEEALRIGVELQGDNHTFVASARNILARVLLDLGELDDAKSQAEQALTSLVAVVDDHHHRTATVRATLGRIKAAQGETAEATLLLVRAVADMTAAMTAEHPLTREAASWLAGVRAN